MSKKIISVLLTMIMILSLFTGCSLQFADFFEGNTSQKHSDEDEEDRSYPLQNQYDKVLAEGDGYYLVSKFEESYNSAYTMYGVVDENENWICPLSANNGFAKAAETVQDAYCKSYYPIVYDYLGEDIFVIRTSCIILGEEKIPDGYWNSYSAHGACRTVNIYGDLLHYGGFIISEFEDGYAFTESGNAGLVYRLDKNGGSEKLCYVDDYFGEPSDGLICCNYIFYDIETMKVRFDLMDFDVVQDSGELSFVDGELYFEFKNPAGTVYHTKIDTSGNMLYQPIKKES